ncbi:MAG: hypothetical protein ABIS35_13700 [Terracoccus sp.]
MLLSWVVVVAVTAVVTTWVVTGVGRDVAGELEQPLPTLAALTAAPSRGGAVEPPPASDTGPSGGAPSPSSGATSLAPADETPRPRTPATSARGTAGGAARPTDEAVTTPTPESRPRGTGRSTPPVAPDSNPTRRATPVEPAPTTRAATPPRPPAATTVTFSVSGGTVAVRCRDSDPVTRSVTPSDGYRFEVEVDREKSTVRVVFSNESREDHLAVTCRGDTPVRTSGED